MEEHEVRTWFFEVWNEPNLSAFWEGADSESAYFGLYDLTAKTIKFPLTLRCGWEGQALQEGEWIFRISGPCEGERRGG